MKIDLTKDEWEYLKPDCYESLLTYYQMDAPIYYEKKIKILKSILEKLGSEWKDDESKNT
jgi:hypothetical protein